MSKAVGKGCCVLMSVCTRPGMMVKDLRVGYSERAGKFQGLEFWVGMDMDMVRER